MVRGLIEIVFNVIYSQLNAPSGGLLQQHALIPLFALQLNLNHSSCGKNTIFRVVFCPVLNL